MVLLCGRALVKIHGLARKPWIANAFASRPYYQSLWKKIDMKQFIKSFVSEKLIIKARKLYLRATARRSTVNQSCQEAEGTAALKCAVSYNKYGGYCIPKSSLHRPAARLVQSGQVHEPETIEYMVRNCRDRDIIHAGTFFGDFLPALSKAVTSNSLVWAFEPNLENFRCAKITLEINDTSNVILTHAGLGAECQRLFVITTDANGRSLGGTSRIVDESPGQEISEPVDVVAIDASVGPERDIGILQLDVEGYEKEALSGAIKTIRRCLPILILEALPESTLAQSDWFAEHILSLGYLNIVRLHRNSVYSCQERHG